MGGASNGDKHVGRGTRWDTNTLGAEKDALYLGRAGVDELPERDDDHGMIDQKTQGANRGV
jgi:hypothetical protein